MTHIFSYRSTPTRDEECFEATWSYGRACRKCPLLGCYRRGMSKSQVIADNKKLVEAKYDRKTTVR